MIEGIRRLLGASGQAPPDSERLNAAINSAREDLESARTQVEALEHAHGDILIYGTDGEAVAHEALMKAAELEVRRLMLAIPRLEELLSEARQRELDGHVEATFDAAIAARDEGITIIQDLRAPFEEIVRAMNRLKEIDRQIEQAGRLVREQPDPPQRVRKGLMTPNNYIRPHNRSLYEQVVLPQISAGAPSWGAGVRFNQPPERSLTTQVGPGPLARVDVEGERAVTIIGENGGRG